MRATTVLPACLFVALIVFCSGFLSAFALVSKPAPQHHLSNLHSPDLWPADVRRVRVAGEGMTQRVAEAKTSERSDLTGIPATRISLTLNGSPAAAVSETTHDDTAGRQEHEDWCKSRYRSYRSTDNSYISYRGQRKACISPMSDLFADASLGGDEQQRLASQVPDDSGSKAARCRARYASYRATDNTYQPFGGPRRVCTLEAF